MRHLAEQVKGDPGPNGPRPTTLVQIQMPVAMAQALTDLALARGWSRSALVRAAVGEYFEKQKDGAK